MLNTSLFVNAGMASQKILEQAKLLAEADVPVLITGERGTGKGAVARFIHVLSDRSRFEFLSVNCRGAHGSALEAELFGTERTTHPGKIEQAEKGTLLIEQISELPLVLQRKVMHLLQDKLRITNKGGGTVSADVRILATTSDDVDKAVNEGKLREDLYYRLSTFTVQLPPLRKRRSEIPVLLDHMMQRLADDFGLPARSFTPSIIEACQQHSWPGNTKELESFVKRYLVTGSLDPTADPDGGFQTASSEDPAKAHQGENRQVLGEVEEERISPTPLKTLIQSLRCEAEENAIRIALEQTGWNRKAAARLLQVSYRNLLYKIERYGMRTSEQHCFPVPAGELTLVESGNKRLHPDRPGFQAMPRTHRITEDEI